LLNQLVGPVGSTHTFWYVYSGLFITLRKSDHQKIGAANLCRDAAFCSTFQKEQQYGPGLPDWFGTMYQIGGKLLQNYYTMPIKYTPRS
jgi:hypothetical protein